MTSSNGPGVLLRKVVDGKTVKRVSIGPCDALLAAFSPDGRSLALGGTRPDVWLYDLRPDGTARPLGIPVEQTSSLAFSQDGGTLAVASDDCNEIFLSDVYKGQLRSTLRGHESPVQNLTFSPDGQSLASAEASNPVIHIWDLPAARSGCRLLLTAGPVRALAYSPDGALLASVSGRVPRVQLWDPNSGQEQRQFEENFTASHVAFSANGQFLASADYDGTIRVRRVATGELCNSMATQPAWIAALAVSSDGRRLAVSGNNGDFCIWNLDKIRAHRTWAVIVRHLCEPPPYSYLGPTANGTFAQAAPPLPSYR